MSGPASPAPRLARYLLTAVFLAAAVLPAAASARTQIVHWSPFAASGELRPSLIASDDFGGDCWTGSFVVHGAYRCNGGDFLYDPCWKQPGAKRVVVCVSDPATTRVVRLHVTGHMNRSGSARRGAVWSLQLGSGAQCTFVQGASNVVGHRRLNDFCRHPSGAVFGSLDRRRATWRAWYSRSVKGTRMHEVPVRRVYVGAT